MISIYNNQSGIQKGYIWEHQQYKSSILISLPKDNQRQKLLRIIRRKNGHQITKLYKKHSISKTVK